MTEPPWVLSSTALEDQEVEPDNELGFAFDEEVTCKVRVEDRYSCLVPAAYRVRVFCHHCGYWWGFLCVDHGWHGSLEMVIADGLVCMRDPDRSALIVIKLWSLR